jgi:hypothetical protein
MRNGRARRRFLEFGQKNWPSGPPRLNTQRAKMPVFRPNSLIQRRISHRSPFFENQRKVAHEGGGRSHKSFFESFQAVGWGNESYMDARFRLPAALQN